MQRARICYDVYRVGWYVSLSTLHVRVYLQVNLQFSTSVCTADINVYIYISSLSASALLATRRD